MVAVAHCYGDDPLPQASLPGGLSFSFHYGDVNREADRYCADFNVAAESLDHTVVNTKFSKLQNASGRDKVFLPFHIIDLIGFSHKHSLAVVAGNISPNNPLQRNAEEAELQVECSCFFAQFSHLNSQCDTRCEPRQERVTESIHFQTSLAKFKND